MTNLVMWKLSCRFCRYCITLFTKKDREEARYALVRMSSLWLVFKLGFFLLQGEHVAAVPAHLGVVLRHGTDSNGLSREY
jgi:hypothetical protein